MSKCVQIVNGFVHWDASSRYSTAEEARRYFASDIIFVDAPDYVFEGWGFDADLYGDDRFIKPPVPEGWVYDAATGTFYIQTAATQAEEIPTVENDSIWSELAAAVREGINSY